jgi:hypothetical protein
MTRTNALKHLVLAELHFGTDVTALSRMTSRGRSKGQAHVERIRRELARVRALPADAEVDDDAVMALVLRRGAGATMTLDE